MEIAEDSPFTAILSKRETILWMGKPDHNCALQNHRKGQRIITFVILGMLGVVVVSAIVDKAGWGMVYFYSFVVAFWFAVAALSYNSVDGRDWQYAVTDKRVLFYDPHAEGNDEIQQIDLEHIKKVYRRPKRRCNATVVFEAQFLALRRGVSFFCVANAAEVQELVVSLLPGARE